MTRHKIWFALCSVGFTIAVCLFIAGRFTKEDAVLGATKLLAPQGGTGQSTYATGDILIANSTGTLDKLSVGAASTILTSVSGAPAWSANVSSTNLLAVDATSTRWMGYTTASGSQLNANASTIGTLTVGNCIGCATISGQLQSTSTLQMITNNGATTTNEVYLQGGALVASSTFTNDVTVVGSTNLQQVSSTRLQITGASGLGYIDLPGQSPRSANPPAGSVRLSSITSNGFSRLLQHNEATTDLVLGRDSVAIAKNTSGATVTPGQVVYISGSTGAVPNIALAHASSSIAIKTVFIVVDSIANNGFGQVMRSGILDSIDTSAFATGDAVYLSTSTPGALTNIRPSGTTDYVLRIGSILNSGIGNGSLNVNIAPAVLNTETGTNAPVWTGSRIEATSSTITNVTSTSFFVSSLLGTSSTIATLNAGTLAANTLSWLTGVGINTTSTSLFATSFQATSGTITTLAAGTFYADSSVTTYATTTKIFSTTASSTNLYTVNFTSSNSVITGGTMNGVVIGGTSAAAASFTTLGASGLSTLAALTFTSGTSTGVFAMQTATATTMNVFNLYASGTIDLAAGRNITVAGVNPRKTITLSAAGGWPTALQGATTATKAEVSNGLNYWASGFQPSGSNHQQWNVPMPDGYDGGTMTCSFYLTATSTPSHTGGCFGIRGVAINDSSLLTTTFGASSTEVCVSHNWAANTQRVSSSTVLTIGNTPTGASNIWFDVFRNTDNASDTATNTLQLLNAECDYGTATYSD